MVVTTLGARLGTQPMSSKQYGYLSVLICYTSGMTFLMHRSRVADSSLVNRGLYSIPTSVFLAELLKLAVSLAVEYSQRDQSFYSRLEDQSQDNADELESGIRQAEMDKKQEAKSSSDGNDEGSSQGQSTTGREKFIVWDRYSPQASSLRRPRSALQDVFRSVLQDVFAPDCWKLSVPAALYVAQNLLQMVAITAVSPVTYQAVTQSKLLATTLLSVWLLSRLYSYQQWISIFVLLIGVVLVSVSKIKDGASHSHPGDGFVAAKLLGVTAVLAACTLGSGAAVYMEKVLKSDVKTSLWIRNAQLSLFSLVPAGFAVLYEAWKQGAWHPFQWFGSWAWLTVVARSIGGFLIAFILKQTDALVKGIATSIAMVFSIVIESVIYDVPVTTTFASGALLVLISSCVYVKSGMS